MPPRSKLNEEVFAREFYKSGNAVQSAVSAGWSYATAVSRAHELRERVGIQNKIREMEQKAKENFDLSEEKIVRELMKVGFSNIKDFMDYGSTGEIIFTPLNELSRDQAAAISEVSNSKKFDKDGKELGVDVRLKMNDKLKALEMLGRKIGMFNDKLHVTKQVINVNLDEGDE